jgi:hypothetical protein
MGPGPLRFRKAVIVLSEEDKAEVRAVVRAEYDTMLVEMEKIARRIVLKQARLASRRLLSSTELKGALPRTVAPLTYPVMIAVDKALTAFIDEMKNEAV